MSKINRRDFLRSSMILGSGMAFGGFMPFIEYRRAHAQDKPLKAAMSSAGLAGTWNAQGEEAARWMASLLNVDITWYDGEFDPQAQRAKFDQLSTQSWDFVAVQPGSIGTLIEPIMTLVEANTPIIDMDTLIAPLQDLSDLGVLTFIAPDNVFMAESVVQKLIDKMEGKGKIAHIGGQPGHTGAQARGQGFLNLVKKYPDIQVVDDQPADWDVTRAADLTESVLNRHPDLKAIFADNDDMALSARQIVENAGLGDQVLVGGVDAMPPAIEAVRDGRLVATARNSANRIHSWAVLAGAYAASVGLEQARKDVPFYVLADGPAIFADIDSNPALADEPWKLRNYGLSPADGLLWAEKEYLF
jgi:ribose transport system substrate-binding protein